MRRLILCLIVACAVAALTASVGSAKKKNDRGVMCVLHAKLTAENEFETTGSTSTAKGHTQIKVRNDGTIEFKTQINNRAAENFVAGHIHLGPVNVAGDIVVPLFGGTTSLRHIKQNGVATPNPSPPTTSGAALCQDPGAYYVNYHTTAFPGGAIRDQLR